MEADIVNNEMSKEKQHFLLVKDYKRALNFLNDDENRNYGKNEL